MIRQFLLIFTLIHLSLQQDNFNLHRLFPQLELEDKSVHNTNSTLNCCHGEFWHFVDGMYDGMHIFANVTMKKECFEVIPIVHDKLVQIYQLLKNATTTEEVFDALKKTVDLLQQSYEETKVRHDACASFCNQTHCKMAEAKKFVYDTKSFNDIMTHMFKNLGTVVMYLEEAKQFIEQNKFYNAGFAYGDVIHYLTLWDYQQNKQQTDENKKVLTFLELNSFN